MFHKEGYQIILTSFLIAALIAIGSEYKIDNFILRTVFQIFSLLQLILVLQFFRNPKRETTINKNHLIDLLSEIGYYGDGSSTKGVGQTSVTGGAGLGTELTSTFKPNSTASAAETAANIYPTESRLDVTIPEEANAAAASNAVDFSRIEWLN